MKWPFVPDSQLSGRGDRFRGKLVVASNREPYIHRKTSRGLKLEVPAGGLVSALDTVLRVTGGTWVAWGSGNGDRDGSDSGGRVWVPPACPAYTLRRVWLSAETVKNYYHGFCNMVLWPLFHGEPDRIVCETPFWGEYDKTNRIFAEAVLEEAGEDPFRAVRGFGISIAVGGSPEADYYLRNQGEVYEFLKLLARIPCPGGKHYRTTDDGKGSQL